MKGLIYFGSNSGDVKKCPLFNDYSAMPDENLLNMMKEVIVSFVLGMKGSDYGELDSRNNFSIFSTLKKMVKQLKDNIHVRVNYTEKKI